MKRILALLLLTTLVLNLTSMAGALQTAEDFLRGIASGGGLVAASLKLELGTPKAAAPSAEYFNGGIIVLEPGITDESASAAIRAPAEAPPPPATDPFEILPTTIAGGMTISNATGFQPDIYALLAEPLDLRLPSSGPQILIIHTHGSEAYSPSDSDFYTPTDVSRTEDKAYNVIRVGDELASELEKRGLRVLHDREIYDYPSYTGSYNRSLEATEQYLSQYPDIAIVIDLHRDALGAGDIIYKTVANVSGESSSQLMMLVGTGENGLYHPYWQDNLKLALNLQNAVNNSYPTLARPVALKQERYNQHLTRGSIILEVGSSGNTLREALSAVRLYAAAIAPYLNSLAES